MNVVFDIQRMMLERVKPEHLKNVARVRKSWRKEILENKKYMRLFIANVVRIMPPNKVLVAVPLPAAPRAVLERGLPSSDKMFKYTSKVLQLRRVDDWSEADSIEFSNFIQSIPDSWLKPIRYMEIHLTEGFPVEFIKKFVHFEQLNLIIDEIKTLVEFIKLAPPVDQYHFAFTCDWFDCVGIMLDSVCEKSSSHPTEFPILSGEIVVPVDKLMHFIKNNKFPDADIHLIRIYSCVGEVENFFQWISQVSSERNARIVQNENETGDILNFEIELFHRGMSFKIHIENFFVYDSDSD